MVDDEAERFAVGTAIDKILMIELNGRIRRSSIPKNLLSSGPAIFCIVVDAPPYCVNIRNICAAPSMG
ncbi:MAG: hypothetical protein ABI806_24500 [Candidatus Solibacter sp.]